MGPGGSLIGAATASCIMTNERWKLASLDVAGEPACAASTVAQLKCCGSWRTSAAHPTQQWPLYAPPWLHAAQQRGHCCRMALGPSSGVSREQMLSSRAQTLQAAGRALQCRRLQLLLQWLHMLLIREPPRQCGSAEWLPVSPTAAWEMLLLQGAAAARLAALVPAAASAGAPHLTPRAARLLQHFR